MTDWQKWLGVTSVKREQTVHASPSLLPSSVHLTGSRFGASFAVIQSYLAIDRNQFLVFCRLLCWRTPEGNEGAQETDSFVRG